MKSLICRALVHMKKFLTGRMNRGLSGIPPGAELSAVCVAIGSWKCASLIGDPISLLTRSMS